MSKILNKEIFFNAYFSALTLIQFFTMIGWNRGYHSRSIDRLNKMFDVDIRKQIKENNLNKIKEIHICKNCGKEFTEKYSNYSDGNFCCKKCARSYPTKEKRVFINKNLSQRYKNVGFANGKVKITFEEYNKNPKICPICGNIISYEKRMRKTCSQKCGRRLGVINNEYKNCGGYREGSTHSKHGHYKGIWCDSTYELAYLIYCLDHNIDIKRCNETFEYKYEGKIHKYHPDFIVEGTIIEIKGRKTNLVDVKAESVDKPYKILYKEDLQEVFEYVAKTYNKKYCNSHNNFYELYDEK